MCKLFFTLCCTKVQYYFNKILYNIASEKTYNMSEKRYKQTEIPSVRTKEVPKKNRAKFVTEYYSAHLQGQTVVNKHLGIKIIFNSIGKSELAYGRALHAKKIAILFCLADLVREAEYSNFGNRKTSDSETVLGYLNFKVKIDDKIENARISILLKTNLKAYYGSP